MANELPVTAQIPSPPPDVNWTPAELIEFINENFALSSGTSLVLFVGGSTEPSTNVGPWLKDDRELWLWDETTGAYTPADIPAERLGYVVSAAEPDETTVDIWFVLGGTGQAEDIRLYFDGAWRSVFKGAAHALVKYKSTGEGIEPQPTTDEHKYDALVSGGAAAAPLWRATSARPGDLKWTMRQTTDPGWLVCDGAAVSRTTYAELFAELGTTWGVGDGSTTFNLPDLRGRGLIGSGTGSGLTARTVGQTGGEETHLQTEAELAAHTHDVGIQVDADNPDGGTGTNFIVSGGTTASASKGSSTPFNVMSPYAVGRVLIFSGVE